MTFAEKIGRYSFAVLSFSLPGLGQLAQKRYAFAVGFFLLFTAVLQWQLRLWLLPLVALAASWETLRVPQVVFPPVRKRQMAYAVVGGLGLFAWLGLVFTYYSPIGEQVKINHQLKQLRDLARQCPFTSMRPYFDCLKSKNVLTIRDPWGSPFDFAVVDGQLEIRCWGPDKLPHTPDDQVFHSSLHGTGVR